MNLLRIGLAAVCGTTLMTAFSYIVSGIRQKQFREPELLNGLVARADFLDFSPSKEHPTGWLLHYKVGLMFSIIYDLIWRNSKVSPTTKSSLIMGAFSGVFGIMVWNLIFKLHPNPPKTKLNEFNLQLLIAHLVFGYYAMKGYLLIEPEEKGEEKKLRYS